MPPWQPGFHVEYVDESGDRGPWIGQYSTYSDGYSMAGMRFRSPNHFAADGSYTARTHGNGDTLGPGGLGVAFVDWQETKDYCVPFCFGDQATYTQNFGTGYQAEDYVDTGVRCNMVQIVKAAGDQWSCYFYADARAFNIREAGPASGRWMPGGGDWKSYLYARTPFETEPPPAPPTPPAPPLSPPASPPPPSPAIPVFTDILVTDPMPHVYSEYTLSNDNYALYALYHEHQDADQRICAPNGLGGPCFSGLTFENGGGATSPYPTMETMTAHCISRCIAINAVNGWYEVGPDQSTLGPSTTSHCQAIAVADATNFAPFWSMSCSFIRGNPQRTPNTLAQWGASTQIVSMHEMTEAVAAAAATTMAGVTYLPGIGRANLAIANSTHASYARRKLLQMPRGRRLQAPNIDDIKAAVVAQLGNGITTDDVTVTIVGTQPPTDEFRTCESRFFDSPGPAINNLQPSYVDCITYRDKHHPGAEVFNLRKFSVSEHGSCFFLAQGHPNFNDLSTREGAEWRVLRDQGVADGFPDTYGQQTGTSWPVPTDEINGNLYDEIAFQEQSPPWPGFLPIVPLVFSHYGPEVFVGASCDCGRGTIRSDATAAGLPMGGQAYDISIDYGCDGSQTANQNLWFYGTAAPSNRAMGLQMQVPSSRFNHYWYGADMTWNWGLAGYTFAQICDGNFHNIRVTYAGNGGARKFYWDNIEQSTNVNQLGDGTHADRNGNFCLGCEGGLGGRGMAPWYGTLRDLKIYGGIRTTTTNEAQMLEKVRAAPQVQSCEEDRRCRVGQFRLCEDCPGSDGSYRLTNTVGYVKMGVIIGDPDPGSNLEPMVRARSAPFSNAAGCNAATSSIQFPFHSGGEDIVYGSGYHYATTNARYPKCVPGWHQPEPAANTPDQPNNGYEEDYCVYGQRSELWNPTNIMFQRKYAFVRDSWNVGGASWINRAPTPSSCSATSTRPGRQQGSISGDSFCDSQGWTWTQATFDCSQVYDTGFDACFRRSAFETYSCGPANWYHDFDTWQCNGCGGQNAGITLNWGTAVAHVNAFKWAQLCETVEVTGACVDRVQITITHSEGTSTETVSNMQCLDSTDVPSGYRAECDGPFRTRFEERDWLHFNFLSQTYTDVTSMTFTLASTSATTANGGHAGAQQIEVGYADRPRALDNTLGAVFWIPDDQSTHHCSSEIGIAATRGVNAGAGPAQCPVSQRGWNAGTPVFDNFQNDYTQIWPGGTTDWFNSAANYFGYGVGADPSNIATFQITSACWQSVGSPTGFQNIKVTKVGGERFYVPVHMSSVGPDPYGTIYDDGSHDGTGGRPGGAPVSIAWNYHWGRHEGMTGDVNMFVSGDIIEFYPDLTNTGAGYDCQCLYSFVSPPPPPLPPPAIPPQPQPPPPPPNVPPPFPPGFGCPRVRFRQIARAERTWGGSDNGNAACQEHLHETFAVTGYTIWDAARLATTRLPVCGEGMTVAFEYWQTPVNTKNWDNNPILTLGDFDGGGIEITGASSGERYKALQIRTNNDETNSGVFWGAHQANDNTKGMAVFESGFKKVVFRVQETGGYTFEVDDTVVMSGSDTFCTNNQKVCIMGYNRWGEIGQGVMRRLEIFAGGGVNDECLYVNHGGPGPRPEWRAFQEWVPGVDYGNPTGASAPFAFAAASASVPDPAVTLAAAQYNALLSSMATTVVGPVTAPLDGYVQLSVGMCHDEPATGAAYRFVESDGANFGICRDKCSLHNRGLLTDARYANASGHCEAYEVGEATCHWYAPPAGQHIMVSSLSSVGSHVYYGTADTPLYCFASSVPPPPPSPPGAPSRPPAPPITEQLTGHVEELSPFDTYYRYSTAVLQTLHNSTITPYECLAACKAHADCDYAAWHRSDCQASPSWSGGFKCVLAVYDAAPATPVKHQCNTEGAFRHFVFNHTRVCDSSFGELGSMTCPAATPHCLGHIPYTIATMEQNVGSCNADPNADTSAPKPPPPLDGICRNTCVSPTHNNRGEFPPSAQNVGNGICEDGGLDAKASGNPAEFACAYGTDCADCGVRPFLPNPLRPVPLCSNTCTGYEYAYDTDGDGYVEGIACRDSYTGRPRMPWEDDSALDWFTGYCGYGTDCAHCGVRHASGVVHEAVGPVAPRVDSLTDWVPVDYSPPLIGAQAAVAASAASATTHSHSPHSHAPTAPATTHSHSPHSHTPGGGYGRRV